MAFLVLDHPKTETEPSVIPKPGTAPTLVAEVPKNKSERALTLANIDKVFAESLLLVDNNHTGRISFTQLDATANRNDLGEAQRELFAILRESRDTIADLDDRNLFFHNHYITMGDIKSLQRIGREGTSSVWTVGRLALDNAPLRFAGTSLAYGAIEYAWAGAAAPEAVVLGLAGGTLYTTLVAAAQAGDYLLFDREKVQHVLDQFN